ncbi:MAG: methyltransferase domain-containing protein [Magnetovibrionaceae bacterium]
MSDTHKKNCPVCGETAFRPVAPGYFRRRDRMVRYPGEAEIVACERCEVCRWYPLPNFENTEEYGRIYYDRFSTNQDGIRHHIETYQIPHYAEARAVLLERFPPEQFTNWLDVGSGGCPTAFDDYCFTTVEPDPEAVAVGRRLFRAERIVQGTAFDLDPTDRSFDGVLFLNSFYCLSEPNETLQHIRRLLRADGVVAIAINQYFMETPSRTPDGRFRLMENVFSGASPWVYYARPALKHLFARNGFRYVSEVEIPHRDAAGSDCFMFFRRDEGERAEGERDGSSADLDASKALCSGLLAGSIEDNRLATIEAIDQMNRPDTAVVGEAQLIREIRSLRSLDRAGAVVTLGEDLSTAGQRALSAGIEARRIHHIVLATFDRGEEVREAVIANLPEGVRPGDLTFLQPALKGEIASLFYPQGEPGTPQQIFAFEFEKQERRVPLVGPDFRAPPKTDGAQMDARLGTLKNDPVFPEIPAEKSLPFVMALIQALPPQERAPIAGQLQALTGNRYQEAAFRKFVRLLAERTLASPLAPVLDQFEDGLADEVAGAFIRAVNESAGDGRTIVHVSRWPYFQSLRQAAYLRERGVRVFLLCRDPGHKDLQDSWGRYFDGFAHASQSKRLLEKILAKLEPDVFHVECWMFNYYLAGLVMDHRGGAKVVSEFYDITSVYMARDDLCRLWDAPEVDLELAMEHRICTESDAVLTRMPEPVHEELRERHGAMAPIVQFWPYPCPSFFAFQPEKPSKDDGIIRLVYTGGAFPLDRYHPHEIFLGGGFLPMIKRLLDQGLALDVLHDPHRPLTEAEDEGFSAYFALTHQYPLFRVLPGVEPNLLAQATAHYDFGINLYEMSPYTLEGPGQKDWSIGTKPFSYLEAGLPSIVNAERYTGRWTAENNLGISVAADEIDNLAQIIRDFDYDSCMKSIHAYNEEHSMDREIERLTAVYSKGG